MKPVILTFASYYLPGYRAGGPIRTIANMVAALSDDFDFKIIALDRDLGDMHAYPGVQQDTWLPCGRAMVRYVSAESFGLRKIQEIARSTPHDVIYLNSFFDPRFTLQVLVNHRLGRLCARPVVIASRGEFSSGALRIKSFKKFFYIRLVRMLKLYDGLTWQASSSKEADDIERAMSVTRDFYGRLFTSGHVLVAPDLTDSCGASFAEGEIPPSRAPSHPLRICSLSRITPMKNLDFAIRALGQVRVPVRFEIYGPVEDAAYWAECEVLVSTLPSNIEVVYSGAIEPAEVAPALRKHDLFFLPTRGENFGHVIYEALRAGLPLLISDQTPWQGLEAKGVGWDLPLIDTRAFALRIEEIADWSPDEYQQCALRARDLALTVAEDKRALEANRSLFFCAIDNAIESKKHLQGDK